MKGEQLQPPLRKLLELDFKRLADEGHIPAHGEREVRFRIDAEGFIRWFEPSRVRVPSSELESELERAQAQAGRHIG